MVVLHNGPLGVFDSGVGGLTVVREIRHLLPHENLVYFADQQYCPYGAKPLEVVRERAFAITEFLLECAVKLVVVACNTASTAALGELRARYSLPFVGIVPAVKPASLATKTRKIGVLATDGTVHAELFEDLLQQFAEGLTVLTETCPGLVEVIEAGEIDSARVRAILSRAITPLREAEVDALVLGCTHFPFVRPLVEELAGPFVEVIDTGLAVARQVARVLEEGGLLAERTESGTVEYHTSGDMETFLKVIAQLEGRALAQRGQA